MHGKESDDDQGLVDAAFNRVLEAEAQARLRVEDCRRQAAARINAAAERARRVEQRTEARLLITHRRVDASVARALHALAVPGTGADAADPAAEARLDRLVAVLADEIIGLGASAPETVPSGPEAG